MSDSILADRIKQTTTTTGTGTLSLSGTIPTGSKSFVSGVGSGNKCFFCVAHQTLDEWEISEGTITSGSPDTLSRTSLLASSTGSAVSFSAGTKDVFTVAPTKYGIPLIATPTAFSLQFAHQTALSSTAGNTRGDGTVDLQIKRSANTQVASGIYAVIAGGQQNTSSGARSSVGGGYNNIASSKKSVVAGGDNNTASGSGYNAVGGGSSNTASALYSAIAGGISNAASGNCSSVVGGKNNTSSGNYSNVCGGRLNTASSTYGVVLGGKSAVADKYGQIAHATGAFSSAGDAQTSRYLLRNTTTNNTQTELFLDNSSARMTLPNDSTWAVQGLISARRTDANDESGGWEFKGVIDRNASAATTAVVGAGFSVTTIAADSIGWSVAVDADTTNGSLRIRVTGENSKTIQWVAYVRTVETTG